MNGAPARGVLASLLVDAADDGPFKAEVLVRSLTALGGLLPHQIVVHRPPELDDAVVAPLRELGARVNVLPRAPDGPGNELLRQLDGLEPDVVAGAEGAWLFALGTAVTAPLPAVAGDAVLLDPGLLYVPRSLLGPLREAWQRSGPAADAALAALGAPIVRLRANDSFPLDADALPASYDPGAPVRALRCGERFDAFGFVSAAVRDPRLDAAVAALNGVIAQPSRTPYFALYKRAAARRTSPPVLADGDAFAVASAAWERAPARRLRLVLHAGTPKTATKALQHALYERSGELARAGIWYPPAHVDPEHKKHQFFIAQLLAGDGVALAAAFDEIVRSAPEHAHTIVVSTEGFFNHWWDFPPSSKAMIRRLASVFGVQFWACFREPVDFAISQHAQLVRNPREFSPAYGLDAGLDEMLDIEWFSRRLDYLGFVCEAEDLVGAGNVRVFRYGPDIVERVFRALGAPPPPPGQVNPSLRAPGVELMRIVNRYALPEQSQHRAASLVLQLDMLIGDRAEPLRASDAAAGRVRALTARTWAALEEALE